MFHALTDDRQMLDWYEVRGFEFKFSTLQLFKKLDLVPSRAFVCQEGTFSQYLNVDFSLIQVGVLFYGGKTQAAHPFY